MMFIFHSNCRLDSSSPPDSASCYKSAVDDDDEDEHLVTAASVSATDEFVDFESVEPEDILAADNCPCNHSDCAGGSPLPEADTFLTGHSEHQVPPVGVQMLVN